MGPDVSVCIASFRRPQGLVRLLESLERQKLPAGVSIEILVVDNDPAAGPSAATHDEELRGGHPLRRLAEPRANVARARNRAVETARGRWLAFVDDDESADESWLAAALGLLETSGCDGCFGPVLPRLEPGGSSWLADCFDRPRHASGALVPAGEWRTGNAVVRRSLFDERRFDPAFGIYGGEDSELFGRMVAAGARFRWCDEARVTEWIPVQRQRLSWLARRAFRGGFAFTRLALRGGESELRHLLRAVAATGLLALVLPAAAVGGRRAAARIWLRLAAQAGHLRALLGDGAAS